MIVERSNNGSIRLIIMPEKIIQDMMDKHVLRKPPSRTKLARMIRERGNGKKNEEWYNTCIIKRGTINHPSISLVERMIERTLMRIQGVIAGRDGKYKIPTHFFFASKCKIFELEENGEYLPDKREFDGDFKIEFIKLERGRRANGAIKKIEEFTEIDRVECREIKEKFNKLTGKYSTEEVFIAKHIHFIEK